MNTHATTTREHLRSATITPNSPIRSLRTATRRVAKWLNDDPMSTSFSAARERDQRLLRRAGSR
jgi:hypothetical protein